MTLYAKNTGSRGTISLSKDRVQDEADYFELPPGQTRELPDWAAQAPGFKKLFDADQVTVAENDEMEDPLEELPEPSTPGEGTAPSAATTSTAGVVKQAAAQADSSAEDAAALVTDFNGLLEKLRTAGILAS